MSLMKRRNRLPRQYLIQSYSRKLDHRLVLRPSLQGLYVSLQQTVVCVCIIMSTQTLLSPKTMYQPYTNGPVIRFNLHFILKTQQNKCEHPGLGSKLLVFNTTFNNISVIAQQSVLLFVDPSPFQSVLDENNVLVSVTTMVCF